MSTPLPTPPVSTLRTFRRTHRPFFAQAMERTLKMAQQQGVLDPERGVAAWPPGELASE